MSGRMGGCGLAEDKAGSDDAGDTCQGEWEGRCGSEWWDQPRARYHPWGLSQHVEYASEGLARMLIRTGSDRDFEVMGPLGTSRLPCVGDDRSTRQGRRHGVRCGPTRSLLYRGAAAKIPRENRVQRRAVSVDILDTSQAFGIRCRTKGCDTMSPPLDGNSFRRDDTYC